MELKELCEKTLLLFEINNVDELSDKLYEVTINNLNDYYDEFKNIVGDLSIDWLQKIFQYFQADRKNKKQDYTPKSLAETVAKISKTDNEKVVLDMCAGSGALTIQKWNTNNDLEFICMEFDENVIPYLLFNLAIRNIRATVHQADVLQNEIFKSYQVNKGDKYGLVSEITTPTKIKADVCISNPPYNMRWETPVFATIQKRFIGYEIPPESNANYAFILTALSIANKVTMILPCSVLQEIDNINFSIRKNIIENNLVESVIVNPNNMFESTDIGTCLITFSNSKKTRKIKMLDMRKTYQTEERKQRGQYGSKSHTNRVYKKVFNVYDEKCQEIIIKTLEKEQENIPEFYSLVGIDDIRKKKYSLVPSQYSEFVIKEPPTRTYESIIADYNKIVRAKNEVKITINESLARKIGLDVENYKKLNDNSKNVKTNLESVFNLSVESDDYISFSKRKNEFNISSNNKDTISVLMVSFLKELINHIKFLHQQENIILAELRDTMLPDLLSGKIDVSNL